MSKDLTARVRLDTKQAEKALTRMEKKLNKINVAVNRTASSGFGSFGKSIDTTNKKLKQSGALVDQLTTKVKRLANAYLGVMATKATVNTSDMITSAENRLNALNGGDTKQTQGTMDKMYASSQKVRMGYSDMMQNVSKSITLAGDAFQNNVDNAIRFQEIMAEAYAIGGASAAEQSSSMYQLIQGLGSGILQGDELRSVREGAPLAYKAIEKFAQGIYGAEENLKDLASEGKITSDIVVAAMMEAGAGMDEAFAKTKMTFAQAWKKMQNTAIKAFEPVLQMLNNALNSSTGQSIISGITIGIQLIANTLRIVFNIIGAIVTFVQNNGKLIATILLVIGGIMAAVLFPKFVAWLGYLGFLAMYYAYVGSVALASGIKAMIGWLAANWVFLLIILIIVAVVAAIMWLSDSFADVCGNVMGAIYVAGEFFKNVWYSILNIALGIGNALKAIFQNIGIAFKNVWLECKAKFWDFVGAVYEGVLKVANIINKVLGVFGLEINTSSLEAAVNTAKAQAEKNRSEKLEYHDVAAAYAEGASTYDTWQEGWATDAFNKGYAVGEAGGQWVTDKVSQLGNLLTGGDLPGGDLFGVGGGYDPSTALENIDGNTGSMADSMELTNEDLSYLRRVAEMEWKKEFTTANITVDMSNYNTINGDNDLDGIVTKLADKLYEELNVVADGVY